MPTLRAIRLLNSVEATTTSGSQLQDYLLDKGVLADFRVLLSMRGQTRRIAACPETVTAIIASELATDAVFAAASSENSTACAAIVQSPLAMSIITSSASTLNTLALNSTSWGLFSASPSYEVNVKSVIALLADVDPTAHSTKEELIADSVSMAQIAASDSAISACVASPAVMGLVTSSTFAMTSIYADASSLAVVANSEASMKLIGNSSVALGATTSLSAQIMSDTQLAIFTLSKNPAAWETVLSDFELSTNLKNILANITGLNPSDYGSVNAMIDSPSALASIASYTPAVQAFATSASAMTYLSTSANIGVILNSASAMAVIGQNDAAMSEFLANPDAVAPMFASSAAKGFIVASTALVDFIAATPSIISYLTGIAVTAIPASLRESTTATAQSFDGIPNKVLTLRMRANNIGAIPGSYNFAGSPAAGTGASDTTGLKGSVSIAKVAGYTDPQWGVGGIAVTAAASPEWTFVDMT